MNLVFDTSALVKLLIEEEGSDVAAALWEHPTQHDMSAIALPEAQSAVRAAARGDRISSRRLRKVRDDLLALWAMANVAAVDDSMARLAAGVADRTGLKGAGAIHVATGLAVGAEETVLVTWDQAMADAATELGLTVAPA